MLPKLKMVSTSNDKSSPSVPSGSESIAYLRLPQDLITEILLHLPAKSLGRFKCVSKPWLSLIETPKFIKSHFSTCSREGRLLNQQLLFVSRTPDSGIKHCSLSAALQLHNPSTNVSDIEYPSPNHQGDLQIVGIVNGLVCLSVGLDDLYICNPVLKQSKHLPSSRSILLGSETVVHGFGYDESNDDYKVVKVLDGCVGVDRSNVKVYSLKSDAWRTIEGYEGGNDFGHGTYANGKILWTNLRASSSSRLARSLGYDKWKIVSLDMASEKYEEVDGPWYEIRAYGCEVGSFGGRISMLCCWIDSAELWVKDANGWSEVFSVPYDACVHGPPQYDYTLTKVVCILGDGGEIVLEDSSGLIVYRSKTKEFRNIELDGGGLYSDFFVYVESLVAL